MQNSANHRVFERKLRPRLDQGHLCQSVTATPTKPFLLSERVVRVKVAIRTGPTLPGVGRLGWLKWREFGRRGDTARDQVIQAPASHLQRWWRWCPGAQMCVGSCRPVWLPRDSKAGPSRHPGPPSGGRKTKSRIRPLIREDYPLSLSISLSGGEETNQDFPSNGERTGKSPA